MEHVECVRKFLVDHINFEEPMFLYSIAVIVAAPLIWNILARLQYYYRVLSTVFCGRKSGCYVLALWIFSFSSYRDYVVKQALELQSQAPCLDSPLVLYASYVLFGLGSLLVVSSFYQLGLTGTYLGDYFGFLLEKKVTAFPFNIMSNPMYNGSTMCFIAMALEKRSPAGLALAVVVFVVYRIALVFEESFTGMIYAKRDEARKAAAAGKGTKKEN